MKIKLKFGSLTALAFGIWLLVMHFLGRFEPPIKESSLLDLVSVAIVFVGIYLAMREKTKTTSKNLEFKEIFAFGVWVSVIMALLIAVIFPLYYKLVNPAVLDYAAKVYKLNPSQQISIIIYDAAVQFGSSLVTGLIFSLIIGVIYRVRKGNLDINTKFAQKLFQRVKR